MAGEGGAKMLGGLETPSEPFLDTRFLFRIVHLFIYIHLHMVQATTLPLQVRPGKTYTDPHKKTAGHAKLHGNRKLEGRTKRHDNTTQH